MKAEVTTAIEYGTEKPCQVGRLTYRLGVYDMVTLAFRYLEPPYAWRLTWHGTKDEAFQLPEGIAPSAEMLTALAEATATPVRNALADLERAVQDADLVFAEKLPEDIRWRLYVLACSINDFTFWVQEVEGGWQATEVETGVSGAVAPTPQTALDSYWKGER